MIRAGRLRHRIEFVRNKDEKDEFGEDVAELVVVGTARASIEPLRGREFVAADAVNSEVDTKIRLRWHSGVLPSDRIRHGEELYDIKGAIDVAHRGRVLEVMAARVDQ